MKTIIKVCIKIFGIAMLAAALTIYADVSPTLGNNASKIDTISKTTPVSKAEKASNNTASSPVYCKKKCCLCLKYEGQGSCDRACSKSGSQDNCTCEKSGTKWNCSKNNPQYCNT